MSKLASGISDEEMLNALDEQDKSGGVNLVKSETPPPARSLGKIESRTDSTISGANDPRWKVIPFESLSSGGLFYPIESEISIRSADVLEIRHWSGIDENDAISVNDCLNFILEKCLRFKIRGQAIVLNWQDLLVIDRLYLIFRIHELTFPNGENKLMKTFSCLECPTESKYSERKQVKSSMLQNYEIPSELDGFYHSEYRTFFIDSKKFDPFYLFMPTLGGHERVKQYITHLTKAGRKPEQWFIRVMPYLIEDYQSTSIKSLEQIRQDSLGWSLEKMMFVTLAVDQLELAKTSQFHIKCPKCGKKIRSTIFSSDSFTVKNLFLFSARLADLI